MDRERERRIGRYGRQVDPEGVEGGGPGGGSDAVRQHRWQPEPGRRAAYLAMFVVALVVVLVPILWVAGFVARVAVQRGVAFYAAAGYGLLAVVIIAGAIGYFWALFARSS